MTHTPYLPTGNGAPIARPLLLRQAGELGHPSILLLDSLLLLRLLLELCHELLVRHRDRLLLLSDVRDRSLKSSLSLELLLLLRRERGHLSRRPLNLPLRYLGHWLLILLGAPLYDDIDRLLYGLLHFLIIFLLALWANFLLPAHPPLLLCLLESDLLSALAHDRSAGGLQSLLVGLLRLLRFLAEYLLSHLPDYLVHCHLLITIFLKPSS